MEDDEKVHKHFVVRSFLNSDFKDAIEDIVQLRSRVQALGNMVFTKALLLAASKGSLPTRITSQAFFSACMRAVCVRGTDEKPKPATFVHSGCLPFLLEAQAHVVDQTTSFDSDSKLTETFNQAAREYNTVFTNNVFMHFSAWQHKLLTELLADEDMTKDAKRYVVAKLKQVINRAPNGPNADNYKSDSVRTQGVPFSDGDRAKSIVEMFKKWMKCIPDKKNKPTKDWFGIVSEFHIKKNIDEFTFVGIQIATELEKIGDHGERSPRIPQVIPQLTFKTRAVTFGVQQTAELCGFIDRGNYGALLPDDDKNKKQKTKNKKHERHDDGKSDYQEKTGTRKRKRKTTETKKTNAEWLRRVPEMFGVLFNKPKRLHKTQVSVVTTDGVSASWHLVEGTTPSSKTNTKKKKKKKMKKMSTWAPKDHRKRDIGYVGADILFDIGPSTTIIGVDPGHANIMECARSIPGQPTDISTTELTKFSLKNTTWRDQNGNRQYLQRIESQNTRHGMQKAIDILSQASSRSIARYDRHITARLQSSPVFLGIMKLKNRRRWKFESYQKEQRAVHKLAAAILDGVDDKSDVVVAWGDGSFGPTSRGHASAPNKQLREQLSRFMTIALVDEFRTSKMSCCCETSVSELRTKTYKRRATVVKCNQCMRVFSRDFNAAVNIVRAFEYQNATKTTTNQFRDTHVRVRT